MSSAEDSPRLTDARARVAIDLGAESCRVSLLRWLGRRPQIDIVHRIANSPVHRGHSLRWPLAQILSGLEDGLRKAAAAAPQGIASIAVDGWAVDYVRLGLDDQPLAEPHCYRDERTIAAKEKADAIVSPESLFARTGAQPLRINTLYQLLADAAGEVDAGAPWLCLPEYVLHWLGGRRVAEYTNATHTGLVDPRTGDWDAELFALLGIPIAAAPPLVSAGTIVGRLQGPLAELDAYRETVLIAPACHDTASAIAGIPTSLERCAYICSGTWSLVGTLVDEPIVTPEAMHARYTNQGAPAGGFCFHSNVNGMWLIKQCMDAWAKEGRTSSIEDLIQSAAGCVSPGIIDVDAEPLLLNGEMPARIDRELERCGLQPIGDIPGNEPLYARLIFESLASRYASALNALEQMLGRRLDRIHILGGGSRNGLLAELTAQRTGRTVETGDAESSTMGNFAVQMAVSESGEIEPIGLRRWAQRLCRR